MKRQLFQTTMAPRKMQAIKVLDDNKNIATRAVKQQNRNRTSQVFRSLAKKRSEPTTMKSY